MDGFLIKPLDREKLTEAALAGLACIEASGGRGPVIRRQRRRHMTVGCPAISQPSKTASIRGSLRAAMQNGELRAIDPAPDPAAAAGERSAPPRRRRSPGSNRSP